jgi:hypothetical protein
MASANATLVTEVTNKDQKPDQKPDLDQYGRDAAERIVELSPHDAEFVNREVIASNWQTYDAALTYVIGRGLAEISRSRKAAAELREARNVKQQGKLFSEMLKVNPALVTDPKFVAKMIAALGVKTTQ